MKYLLSRAELDALTPITRLQARNEALEVACNLIVTEVDCAAMHYCDDCPIGRIEDQRIRDHICMRYKNWSK